MPSSRTRGRQEEVFNEALGYPILLVKISAPVNQIDLMALSLHVPARSAPVAGAWFKRNVRPQPCALSVSPVTVHAIMLGQDGMDGGGGEHLEAQPAGDEVPGKEEGGEPRRNTKYPRPPWIGDTHCAVS